MSKLSNAVTNEVVKKTKYDNLVGKVNNIDTKGFVLKTKNDTDKLELENKIPDTSGLVKKIDCNTILNEIEGKIPDISNLAAKTGATSIENIVSNLVKKKTDFIAKVTEIENKLNNHNHYKYIDTPEFNKLAGHVFNARLAQGNLVTTTDFDDKLSNSNRKITKNKTDHALVQNELKKMKTFDLSYFIGKNCFEEDGTKKLFSISTNNQVF